MSIDHPAQHSTGGFWDELSSGNPQNIARCRRAQTTWAQNHVQTCLQRTKPKWHTSSV